MLRKLARILILICLLAGLAGTAGGTASARPLGADPTGTVTLWYGYASGSAEETALNSVIAAAESAYPTLDIIAERHDFTTLLDDYKVAQAAGGGPDLLLAVNDSLFELATQGYLLYIDTYVEGRLTNVSLTAIDSMKVNGLIYGVPESFKAVALYYNKSMVPAPPATTSELLSMLQAGESLAAQSIVYHMYGMWAAFGGQLMDSSGWCTADQSGFVPAMQYFLDLQTAGAQLSANSAMSLFTSGQAGMLVDGPWVLKELETALGTDLGAALLPAGPAGAAAPLTGTDGFFVNPNTSNAANAVETALYLTNQASSLTFTEAAGHVPVRSDVSSTDPLVNLFAQAANQGEPRPQNQYFGNYWAPFGQMTTDVMGAMVTPQAGVPAACKMMNYLNNFSVVDKSYSAGAQDGWVLESSELSGSGGPLNSTASTFNLGDDALDRQYRTLLSFDTSALPDDAVVTKAILKIKQQGVVGTLPFGSHGSILVDIRRGGFSGSMALQAGDFNAVPHRYGIGTILNLPLTGGWYKTRLLNSALPFINKAGITQLRLQFAVDDNDDMSADYLKFFSGNAAGAASRPVLVITYHGPVASGH